VSSETCSLACCRCWLPNGGVWQAHWLVLPIL